MRSISEICLVIALTDQIQLLAMSINEQNHQHTLKQGKESINCITQLKKGGGGKQAVMEHE